MFYFVVTVLCLYGVFRAYLDREHVKHVESIDKRLKDVADSLYSIKFRLRHDKDETGRK